MLKDFIWRGDRRALHIETEAAVCVQGRLVVQDEMGSDGSRVDLKIGALGEKNLLGEPDALS